MPTYADLAAQNSATSRAQAAAQAEYQKAMASNAGEQTALQRAQFAWQQELDRAGMTGQWQGEWSMPSQQYFANTFGAWGAPTAGQQTLEGQGQEWQQAFNNSQLYGQYFAPGQGAAGPAPGQQTMAGQQQQFQQGFNTWQEQARQEQMRQQTANSYLQLLSQLRGPADWAKYQQVLGATPNGMRDLVAAAMGQYMPGGGATTGQMPQAANLQTMYSQVAGQGGQGGFPWQQQGGQQQQQEQLMAAYQRPVGGGQQASGEAGPFAQQYTQQYFPPPPVDPNYQTPNGGNIPGGNYYNQGQQPGSGTPQEAMGGGANMFGQLPAPNQISAQSWKNMAPSQQQMLLGGYESQGWDKQDVQSLFNQSLPRYASNAASAGTWRLK